MQVNSPGRWARWLLTVAGAIGAGVPVAGAMAGCGEAVVLPLDVHM